MKSRWLVAVALGMVLGSAGAEENASAIRDGIAAVVGSRSGRIDLIPFSEVRQESERIIADRRKAGTLPTSPPPRETLIQAYQEARERLIDQKMIVQEFWRRGYVLPEAILEHRLLDLKRHEGKLPEADPEELRETLLEGIIVQAMRQKCVGPKGDLSDAAYREKEAAWMASLRKEAYIRTSG